MKKSFVKVIRYTIIRNSAVYQIQRSFYMAVQIKTLCDIKRSNLIEKVLLYAESVICCDALA